MEIIEITIERKNQILPKNIIETDNNILSDDAKTVLAVLINYQLLQPKAKETGYVVCPNITLMKSCGWNSISKTLNAVVELVDCNLIIRKAGETWEKGKPKKGTVYYIIWSNLKKEVKKKTSDELLEEFYNLSKSSETPLQTTITGTITNTIPVTNTISIPVTGTIPVSVSDSISTPVTSTEKTKKVNESSMVLDYKKEEKEIEILEEKKKEWEYQLGSMIKATVLELTGEGN